MRILFTRFPLESRHGGAEVQTSALWKGLMEEGHEVEFLGSCPVLLEEARRLGLRTTQLDIGDPPVTKWGSVSFLWRQAQMRAALRESAPLRSRTFDVVCMLSLTEKLLLTEELAERGARVCWIEHDRVGRWLSSNPWLPLLRRASNMATTIVVSELSGRIYQDLGWDPSRVYAIPNGVDTQRLGDARHREHVPMRTGNELHLGCVARLTQDKGVDLLVEAMATLPHATLDIVGDGPERENLRVRAREINAHIRFLGRVPDIAEFYRSLDILVLPSREHDPFGLAAAEAMLLGIPVVVTRACGIADELKNGVDGIVVQPGSATALREGIERLQDPAVRAAMGKKAAQTARETFSMTSMVQSYISVFTQAPQR